MQIWRNREHTDRISLQQIWCALHFIHFLSFLYYDLGIGMSRWAGGGRQLCKDRGMSYEGEKRGSETQAQVSMKRCSAACEAHVRWKLTEKLSVDSISATTRSLRLAV